MVLRSRCTAALLLPGRAAAKYAIPQPAPIAQLDRASDYESEGRVFESPWAHSVFRVVSTRLRVGCVARLGWTSRAGVAACCCGATARTQADGPASHRGRRNPELRASPRRPAESSTRALGSMLGGHASPRLSSCRSRRDKQHRGTPEGGIDRSAERVYGEICGLESIPTAGGFLLVLPVDLPPFLGLR